MTSVQAFCPHCGASRAEWARFCGSCGNSYDGPAGQSTIPAAPKTVMPATGAWIAAPASAPASDSAPGQRGTVGKIIVRLVIGGLLVLIAYLVVAGGMLSSLGSGVGSTGGTKAETPAAGSVWFGDSFDSSTFAMKGRTTTVTSGKAVAIVAQLTKSVESGAANVQITLDGTVVLNQKLDLNGGSGDLVGFSWVPAVAGHYTVTVTDIGLKTLASGSLDVR